MPTSKVIPHLHYNETHARCSSCRKWKPHGDFYQRKMNDDGPPVWPRCKRCRGFQKKAVSKDLQAASTDVYCANGKECVWYERLDSPAKLRSTGRVHDVCESCNERRKQADIKAAEEQAKKSAR